MKLQKERFLPLISLNIVGVFLFYRASNCPLYAVRFLSKLVTVIVIKKS